MKKKWQYNKECNEKEKNKLKEKFKLNDLLSTILVNRGINEKTAETFLKPTRHDFHNPFEMPDMERAINRIITAIENKEKTIIYGDYDVDGITSVTVLKQFLEERGLKTAIYIPNRLQEGYGLNKEAIKKIAKQKYKLMITVDCGITGIEEINLAKEYGIETIVTDHHEPAEILPDAIAVVDCKRKDNKYQFRELAGVGVVFKIIQAISIRLNLPEEAYLKYLDIVSIGTIADIVPLVDENRVITKLGLMLVNQTKNIGLKVILEDIGYKKIDTQAISFGIAPRLNACGRMGFTDVALSLLLAKDEKKAKLLLEQMKQYNYQRQCEEKKIFEEATKQIIENNMESESSIILEGKNWHTGVIGIVSSKITEKYYKPSILLCLDEENAIAKGSRKKHTRI